jgi:uncharacterized protein YjbJ (UPF0337 family)
VDVGIKDKVTGRLKQAAGDLLGDERLRRQGVEEERKGEAKEELSQAEERLAEEQEIAAAREEAARQRAAEAARREFEKADRDIESADTRVEAHEALADRKAAEVEELERRTEPRALAEEMTREELYEEARALGVEGRSDMTKEELAEEITRRR